MSIVLQLVDFICRDSGNGPPTAIEASSQPSLDAALLFSHPPFLVMQNQSSIYIAGSDTYML